MVILCGYSPDPTKWHPCGLPILHQGPCKHEPVGLDLPAIALQAANDSLKTFTQAEVDVLLKAESSKVKIGCITLVRAPVQGPPQFYAVKCNKGRGIILPGGKWDKGESFVECAARELFEETGIKAKDYKLVFCGMSEEGYFTYAFVATFVSKETPTHDEGEVIWATWDDLCQSAFRGYYQLLKFVMHYSINVGD